MRIVPVLDLKEGVVVRGVAGQRHEYRAVVSKLVDSSRPIDVARAFVEQLGLRDIYLADLDAIGGKAPALDVYRDLQALGCRLWVDAGVRHAEQARNLLQSGVTRVVAGLETIAGPEVLAELRGQPIVFSLDLKAGQPLGDTSRWRTSEPTALVDEAVAAGVQSVIVLDLSRVGVDQGTGTVELCRNLANRHPALELIAGGGIRDREDLLVVARAGVTAVLVASALHDGKLP